MKATSQTIQQIERALRKIAAKYPLGREDLVLTDIHLQVKADSGELLAFNDDDEELTRCVVEQWMDNGDYARVAPVYPKYERYVGEPVLIEALFFRPGG